MQWCPEAVRLPARHPVTSASAKSGPQPVPRSYPSQSVGGSDARQPSRCGCTRNGEQLEPAAAAAPKFRPLSPRNAGRQAQMQLTGDCSENTILRSVTQIIGEEHEEPPGARKSAMFTVWVDSASGSGPDGARGSLLPSKAGSFLLSAEALVTGRRADRFRLEPGRTVRGIHNQPQRGQAQSPYD
jgi:hypothetical protein